MEPYINSTGRKSIEPFRPEVLLLLGHLSTVILSLRGTKVRKLSVPAKFFPVNIGLLWGFAPLFPLYVFFRRMPKGWASLAARGLFTGAWRPVPLCYFSLLRQRKVTKRKASPTRTAVLSGRHVDAGFSARPPPTLRIGPAPDGAHALRHERAPTLRSVPPAVF